MPKLYFALFALTVSAFSWLALRTWMPAATGPAAARRPWPWADALGLPVAAGLLTGLLTQSLILGACALALAPLWPRLRSAQRERRRRAELAEQLPGYLDALSAGLRAGMSLPQALAAAAEDLPEPSASLAQRQLAGLGLGEAPEALMLAEAQAQGDAPLASDWRLLATAVGIQRSSGGDLAATFDQLAETLRERQRLLAQVDALTAQGRLSAWVVGLLPLVLLLALQLMDPGLLEPLFTTQTGWVLLGLAVLFEAAGVLLLRRIVDIEA